jgi:hypothetical protein
MSNDQLFQICNTLVLPAWLLLAIVPRWKWTGRIVVSGVILLLSIVYVSNIIPAFSGGGTDFSSFSSLEGVTAMFAVPGAVLVGWVHYLAFDLLAGWFIVNDAARQKIPLWWTVPCLLFSFMLGPTGWLLYWIIRTVKTKTIFPQPVS